jgi:hypothetical protein
MRGVPVDPGIAERGAQFDDQPPGHPDLIGVLILADRGVGGELQGQPEDAVPRVGAVGGAQCPASDFASAGNR